MRFDRFDIVEAYYLAFSENHNGQSSREYGRLSMMARYFKPRDSISYDTLSGNARYIYDNLCERNGWDIPEYEYEDD